MNAKKKTATKLVLISIGMFAFAFALVPIYDVICDITGLNGKTGTIEQAEADKIALDNRTIQVQFVTTLNQSMPIEFEPQQSSMAIKPGQVTTINYRVKNLTSADINAQAIPSVTPALAASHFNKIECFCFENQILKANEEKVFTMRFIVNPKIPTNIKTITLAYTFFDINKSAS